MITRQDYLGALLQGGDVPTLQTMRETQGVVVPAPRITKLAGGDTRALEGYLKLPAERYPPVLGADLS